MGHGKNGEVPNKDQGSGQPPAKRQKLDPPQANTTTMSGGVHTYTNDTALDPQLLPIYPGMQSHSSSSPNYDWISGLFPSYDEQPIGSVDQEGSDNAPHHDAHLMQSASTPPATQPYSSPLYSNFPGISHASSPLAVSSQAPIHGHGGLSNAFTPYLTPSSVTSPSTSWGQFPSAYRSNDVGGGSLSSTTSSSTFSPNVHSPWPADLRSRPFEQGAQGSQDFFSGDAGQIGGSQPFGQRLDDAFGDSPDLWNLLSSNDDAASIGASNHPTSATYHSSNQAPTLPQNALDDFIFQTGSAPQTSDQFKAPFQAWQPDTLSLQSSSYNVLGNIPSTSPSSHFGSSINHPNYMNTITNTSIPPSPLNSFGNGSSSTPISSVPSHQYGAPHIGNFAYPMSNPSGLQPPYNDSGDLPFDNSSLMQGPDHPGSPYNPSIQPHYQPVPLHLQQPYTIGGASTTSSSTAPDNGQQNIDMNHLYRTFGAAIQTIESHKEKVSAPPPVVQINSPQSWARVYSLGTDRPRSDEVEGRFNFTFNNESGIHEFNSKSNPSKVDKSKTNALYTDRAADQPTFSSLKLKDSNEKDKVIYSRYRELKEDEIENLLKKNKTKNVFDKEFADMKESLIKTKFDSNHTKWENRKNKNTGKEPLLSETSVPNTHVLRAMGNKEGLFTGDDAVKKGLRHEGVYLDTADEVIDDEIAANTLRVARGKSELYDSLSTHLVGQGTITSETQKLGLLRALRIASLRQTAERWRGPASVQQLVPLLYMVKHRQYLSGEMKNAATLRSIFGSDKDGKASQYLGGVDLAAQPSGADLIRNMTHEQTFAPWYSPGMKAVFENRMKSGDYAAKRQRKGKPPPQFKDFQDWQAYKAEKAAAKYGLVVPREKT